MAKSGASKGAKKINPFNDGVLIGVNQGPSTPVKLYEGEDYYGNKTKKFLPNFGAGRAVKKGKV